MNALVGLVADLPIDPGQVSDGVDSGEGFRELSGVGQADWKHLCVRHRLREVGGGCVPGDQIQLAAILLERFGKPRAHETVCPGDGDLHHAPPFQAAHA